MIIIKVDPVGNKWWYKDGVRHRDGDLPAVEQADGNKFWYKDGKLHREGDLPAIEWVSGTKSWYKDNKPHRVGGPASVYEGKIPFWYFEGYRITEEQHDFIYRMHMKRKSIPKMNITQ
jgi:hypothetical protein